MDRRRFVVAVEHELAARSVVAQHGGPQGMGLRRRAARRSRTVHRRSARPSSPRGRPGSSPPSRSWVTRSVVVAARRRMRASSPASRSCSSRSSPVSGSSSSRARGGGGQRAGQGHPLRLAAAEVGDVAAAEPGEPDQLEHRLDPPLAVRGAAIPCIFSPKPTFAATSRCGKSCSSWNTIPMPRRWVGTPVMSRPSSRHGARRRARRARR